jgi:hypothetical protein
MEWALAYAVDEKASLIDTMGLAVPIQSPVYFGDKKNLIRPT